MAGHVGLPGRPSAEDRDEMMDQVLQEQDSEAEIDNHHILRDCLRSELKAFAKKYHFDELRNEMTQACEKLRSDLLKDMSANHVSMRERRMLAAERKTSKRLSNQSDFSARDSQDSVASQLENEIRAPREIRMPFSIRAASKPKLKRSLTWSSWVAEGDCSAAVGSRSHSSGHSLRQAGNSHGAFSERRSELENGDAEYSPRESGFLDSRPPTSSKKVHMFEESEEVKDRARKMRMGKSEAHGTDSTVSFYRYVTQRLSSKVQLEHQGTSVSITAAERLDSWRTAFVNCCTAVEQFLDYPIAFAICLNGIFLGIQAQYQSVNKTESLPIFFPIGEIVFCFVFLSEILIRLVVCGRKFFIPPGVWWNTFDTSLVGMQLTEVVGMLTTSHEIGEAPASTNFSFLRLVRVLRLFRVLRLVRLLQFITELNVIISSIANSVRSLFWTMFLLMLMIYMVGITFTQVVFSHRMEVIGKEASGEVPDEVEEQMDYWWGTLLRSTLSLYQAILGGVDWDTLVDPLTKRISVLLAPLFVLYIAFALLAMMNVITGIFVESALKNAAKDKDNDFIRATKELFSDGSTDEAGLVRQEDFEMKMDREELQAFVRQVGIEPRDAKLMFRLIDSDCTGSLYLDQLLSGMLRLRSGVKVLDLAVMMHEQQNKTTELENTCLRQFELMEGTLVDLLDDYVARLSDSIADMLGKPHVPKQLLC